MKKIVFLTGFMGAGKSTIGPILANTLGWDFFDLDSVIEEREGKSVKEIFLSEGEEKFRIYESKALREISQSENRIIALGGGTIAENANLNYIKSCGLLIFLKTSPEIAYERLKYKRDRPSLLFEGENEPSKDEYLNRINSILDSRLSYYEQADISVNTDNQNVGKTVDYLVRVISKEFHLN